VKTYLPEKIENILRIYRNFSCHFALLIIE